jgi:Fe-S cluster biogenesis protein NfuA
LESICGILLTSGITLSLRQKEKEKEVLDMREEVEKALEKIREYIRRDGGDIELVEVTDDGVVKVKLTGACVGCPFSAMTIQQGVQKSLMQEVPGVTKVENVTLPTP